MSIYFFFFFQAEDGIRDGHVTGVQTCALPISCNQKNNREPVMALGEDSVRQALSTLQEKRMAGPAGGADSRVTKYEHRLQEVFNFDRRETAVVCVLLLREPQTPGEFRGRTERMYRFE